MNLTTRQKEIYKKIYSFDSSWTEEGFVKCWNDILKLNKFVSVSQGKLILEFSDPNFATIKFEKDDKVLLEEKTYWNEFIKTDHEDSSANDNEIIHAAQTIKVLADRNIVS